MLTDTLIQNTKPSTKSVRLFDGRGLYLEIGQTGMRWWRFKYRFGGKEKRIPLGVFPDINLKIALERREEASKQVALRIDPSEARKTAKLDAAAGAENTFNIIARVVRETYLAA